MQNTKRVDTW